MSKNVNAVEYQLPAGCSIKSVAIRELDGNDEEIALKAAKAKGAAGSVGEEMIALSIHKVDGKEVTYGNIDMRSWSVKTRQLIGAAFSSINGAGDTNDFLSQGKPL